MIEYTKLKNNDRKVLRDILPLPKPFTLLIEPSSLCNFKCVQCFQSIPGTDFSTSRTNMDMDCFNRIIDDMKQWKGDKLKVLKLAMYGEPLVNPNFAEMLRIAREADIAERIETTSNVSLLTGDISEKLVEYGMDYIRVSIYSPLQEKHAKVTQNDIDIHKIHDNLQKLQQIKRDAKKDRPFVAVKMLDTFNKEENDLFLKLYGDVADELYIDQPHNWIAHEDKSFIKSLYNEDTEKAESLLAENSEKRIACSMPFFTLGIRSNGDIAPCCIDWPGSTTLGNVYHDNLQQLWQGEKMYDFWKMQLEDRKNENKSCRNCEVFASRYYTRDNIDGFPVEKLHFN